MEVSAKQYLLKIIELLPEDCPFETIMFVLKDTERHVKEVARGEGDISDSGLPELKTGKMLRLELVFHEDIRDLINASLKGSDVAQKLGIQIGRHSGQYVRTNQPGRH